MTLAIVISLCMFIIGWYLGRAYEKTLWVYGNRVIRANGKAAEWNSKKKTWTKI